MPESVGDRIQVVRSNLKLSQRAFASELEVSLGAVQSWEHNRSSPNAQILNKICRLGFDGHWLVTGEGEMLRLEPRAKDVSEAGAARAHSADDAVTQILLEELENSRLGETLLLSRRGTQGLQWEILRVLLEEINTPKSMSEIHRALSAEGLEPAFADVVADCRLLHSSGVIRSEQSLQGATYWADDSHTLKAGSYSDRLQALRSSIQILTDLVAPRAVEGNGSAYLQNAVVTTNDPRALIARLREVVHKEMRSQNQDSGSQVHVVLALATSIESEQ